MNTKIRNLAWAIAGFAVGLVLVGSIAKAATILMGYQGGTGYGPTTSASNVGKFLRVSSSSPYLTYDFASALTATPTLQQVTDAGAITTNAITYAGGTSTAGLVVQGILSAPTGSFTYTDATTTNATFATVGTLTGSNATITNVSSTNMSVSSSLLVTGKAVCLVDGTNCLPTSTPTLQQVATAGNTTSLALQFAGGTSTASMTIQGLLTATTASTTGNASIGGTLGLTGAATFGSTLAVTGVSTLATTSITALSVSGNTTGTTAYYTGLTVAGTSDLQGAVFIGTSGATVNGGVTAIGVTTTNLFATTARFSSLSLVSPLPVTSGGTGFSSVAQGDIFYGSASNVISALAKNTTASRYLSNSGTSNNPSWAQVDLSNGVTGQLPLTNGGTNASLTASNGGIFYSTASAGAILAGTATANKVLMSGASGAPSWSTPTFPNASATAGKIIRSDGTNWLASTLTMPDTTAVSTLLYSSSANTIAALATANSGVLVTNGSGVPSIATDIPTAVTIGSSYIYRAGGTDVSVADGGTGASSLTANGVLLGNGTSAVQVTATGTSGQVLTSNGGGSAPTFQSLPGTNTSLTIMSGNFTITSGGGTYQDTGLQVTLPSAGTYIVWYSTTGLLTLSSGGAQIQTRMYNSTDSSAVTGSDAISVFNATTGATYIGSASMAIPVTVAGSKTIKLQTCTNGGTTFTSRILISDGTSNTVLGYTKLY